MKRYLVTGGAGFIGSHLVHTLVEKNCYVRVLDNFDTGFRENLKNLAEKIDLVEGSITDMATVEKAVDGIDFVLHQAARGSVPRSVEDPIGTHAVNLTGTVNVLEASRKAGVQRVVCASSSSVYGETPVLPKAEYMQPSPRSPYALSKLGLEHYCAIYQSVYGLKTIALRYFNIYGPRQNPDSQYAAVIPRFIRAMMNKDVCTIFGDGEQTRDFTFVQDCVAANLLACEAQNVEGPAFNIAAGAQTSVNRLFHTLSEILKYDRDPVYKPARKGDVKHSYADVSRAKEYLDFAPRIPLKEGLVTTVEWFLKNSR